MLNIIHWKRFNFYANFMDVLLMLSQIIPGKMNKERDIMEQFITINGTSFQNSLKIKFSVSYLIKFLIPIGHLTI